MSIEDYKQAGFKVSPLIQQAEIDRAERDVMQAYILPLKPNADIESDGSVKSVVMELAHLLLLQRSIFATRSGAKEKSTPQSYSADRWNILSQCVSTCAMKMDALVGSIKWRRDRRVQDICGILFNTNYINV